MIKHFFLVILLYILLTGCGNTQQIDRQAVLEEMEQREIKRVLPGEVIKAAYTQGDTIARAAQELLIRQYRNARSSLSFPEFLEKKADTVLDSLAKQYDASMQWIPAKDTNNHQLSDLEQQILQAYIYNAEKNLELEHNVQRINNEKLLYTQPLVQDSLKKETGTSQQTATDSSRFLGIWSITLSQKNIIRDL